MTVADSIMTTANGELQCPRCGGAFAHIDGVHLATRSHSGRDEDMPIKEVTLDCTGDVREWAPVEFLARVEGRRFTFALHIYCETCRKRSFIEFRQHEGQTLVSAYPAEGSSSL